MNSNLVPLTSWEMGTKLSSRVASSLGLEKKPTSLGAEETSTTWITNVTKGVVHRVVVLTAIYLGPVFIPFFFERAYPLHFLSFQNRMWFSLWYNGMIGGAHSIASMYHSTKSETCSSKKHSITALKHLWRGFLDGAMFFCLPVKKEYLAIAEGLMNVISPMHFLNYAKKISQYVDRVFSHQHVRFNSGLTTFHESSTGQGSFPLEDSPGSAAAGDGGIITNEAQLESYRDFKIARSELLEAQRWHQLKLADTAAAQRALGEEEHREIPDEEEALKRRRLDSARAIRSARQRTAEEAHRELLRVTAKKDRLEEIFMAILAGERARAISLKFFLEYDNQ